MMKSPSLTVGIEEEYQIIDPETRELKSFITQFMELKEGAMEVKKGELKTGEVKAELHASMVELGTPVCQTVQESNRRFTHSAPKFLELAAQRGLQIRSRLHASVLALAGPGDLTVRPLSQDRRRPSDDRAAHVDLRHARARRRGGSRSGDRRHEYRALHAAAHSGPDHQLALLGRPQHGDEVVSIDRV